MKSVVFAVACLALPAYSATKTEKFDGGAFTVTLDIVPEDWRIQAQPALHLLRFAKSGDFGLAPHAAFEGYVFIDRVDGGMPSDLQKWFLDYLKRTSGFLQTKIFDRSRSFRGAKNNPVIVGTKKLFRFDMATFSFSRPASPAAVNEEGVVYFLLADSFEENRTFFVFTGRQILNPDLGHHSELSQVEKIIDGFEVAIPKKG